jgi:hypothetical protein
MSKNAGKSEMEKSNKLMQDNIARLEAIGIPTIEAQKIALSSPELVGQLQAEFLGPSAFQEVQEDPRLKSAQLSALEEMTQIAKTGLGAEDRAALNEIRRQASGMAQAQKASTMQQMQERGLADSGSNLIAQLLAGQSASDMASQQGDRLASQASSARRQALGQQADLATRMSQQQIALAGQKASAADVINQFNTQNKQGVNAQNLMSKQNIANQQNAIKNQQEMYNKGLIQQDFQNKMAKATGVTGQQASLASMYGQQAGAAAQGQASQNAAILGGITGLAGAGLGAYGDIEAAKAGKKVV